MKKILALTAAMAISSAAFGTNVKASKFGVDFSYANQLPTLGVMWHVTDMIALRPSLGFSSTTTDPNTGSTTVLNFGIAVPIYLANFNALDLYVAPGFTYKSTNTKPATGSSTTASDIGVTAALGLQVKVTDQLHLFGEMGLGYTGTNNGGSPAAKTTVIATGTTSIGATFYFN